MTPFSFQLAHHTIVVKPLPPDLGSAYRADGLWLADSNTIYVKPDVPPSEQVRLLLHELLHAIWSTYSFNDDMDEETVCSRLDVPLATLMKNCPAVFLLMTRAMLNGTSIFDFHTPPPGDPDDDGPTIH